MKEFITQLMTQKTNFIFLGEAGSGKSEIAINFAKLLAECSTKPVHFFDLDMTKPLFRSRDVVEQVEALGIIFHYQEQFYDAPTMVGGINLLLKNDDCYVVMDVGGNDVGARAIGGFAPRINKDNSICYYVLNSFRPWSGNIDHIDGTLSAILGISHVMLGQIHMINNPNNGITTTADEVVEGCKKMEEMVGPYMAIDFTCVKEDIFQEVNNRIEGLCMPIHLYLTYEWLM